MNINVTNLAPIALFVYNRPWHTEKTLDALSKNEYAGDSKLIVYADGVRSNATVEEIQRVKDVRAVLNTKNWCGEQKVVERSFNLGLADNIIGGVTEVLCNHDRVIVLEDDIITSPGFLRYMNDALEFYRNEPKVMHVSGYMFPVKGKLPSTFFYNTASCWGWGTWRDRWQQAEWDAGRLREQIEQTGRIPDFDIGATYPFYDHLKKNVTGEMRTWAVRWYANIFLKGGLALHPFPSLTQNIGMDGQGTHCATTDRFYWSKLADHIPVKPIELRQSRKCLALMKEFNASQSRTTRRSFGLRRIVQRIWRRCAAWVAQER